MILSDRVNSVEASGIRAMFNKARKYDNALYLCFGEPGFVTADDISEVVARELSAGNTKYTPGQGIPELREAVAEKLWRDNGIKADPDKNIMITAGSMEALFMSLMALVNPGDEVITGAPGFPNYAQQIRMAGGIPVYAETYEEEAFRMTAAHIEKQITPKTKLIILNSPCNPTGSLLTKQDYEDIAALIGKHKIMCIADEPYEKILFDGNKHYSLGSFPGMSDYCVTINSMSKTFAMTGYRVGYACAPEELVKTFVKMQEPLVACVSGAMQKASVYALNKEEEYVRQMVEHYKKARDFIVPALNSLKGFSCLLPPATFYAFPNIKGTGKMSQQLADEILEELRVVITPGTAFTGSGGEGYLRISFASDLSNIESALERMAKKFG